MLNTWTASPNETPIGTSSAPLGGIGAPRPAPRRRSRAASARWPGRDDQHVAAGAQAGQQRLAGERGQHRRRARRRPRCRRRAARRRRPAALTGWPAATTPSWQAAAPSRDGQPSWSVDASAARRSARERGDVRSEPRRGRSAPRDELWYVELARAGALAHPADPRLAGGSRSAGARARPGARRRARRRRRAGAGASP